MSEIFDDTNHPVSFQSPLGGKLVVQSMSGDEALGRLFNYNLELLSRDFELHFDQVVGQQVTVTLDLPEDKRYFNAFITEFRYLGHTDRYARYQATLRPWFWFLTRTSDCKIFQEKKVPDIIKEVFRENGMSHFEDRLTGTYREWEYCVQYRETDFNFVSRLMEQEGIYYYFEHFEDKHVLVLTDDMGTHRPFPNFETIPYCPPTGQMSVQEDDHLQHWAVTQSIQPERYAIQDFDFKKPRVDMLSRFKQPGNHDYPLGDPEIYDYPGEYVEPDDGVNYVEIRLQELRGQFERVNAGGPCRGISAGCLFTLEDYPREDQNKEYMVLSVSHQINDTSYISSGGGSSEELYRCQASVMDSEIPYRQVRSTPKPIVQGPQSAIVVGPDSEEIYTDEFGRVKVQFHWDRYGQKDENSSCWVRVSQLWAGAKWGGMHIPRIGQEVLVSFMEGDPDKPVITGRVYNAECMPPYALEQNKTQSGIKSRSTKGGGPDNFNELRFEDKKGSEEVYLHAEKNLTIDVKNAEAETVGTSITTNAGASISRSAGADINRTADDNITDKAGKDITTESGKNMSLKAGGAYVLFTNLGIHLKAMNFVADLIESSAKKAAEALQKGGGAAATATMQGGAGAGADSASNTAQSVQKALTPAILAGASELQAFTDKASDGLSDQAIATNEKASALSDAIESGASPEVVAAAFLALADAALDTLSAPKKMIEGLIEQIPNIELWAMKDVNAHALWSMTLSTKTRDISIQAENKDINVKAKKNIKIEAEDQDIDIKASKKNIQITGKEKISLKAEDKDLVIEAAKKKVKIKSADQIFLQCGSATISMSKSGNIVIKGAKVNIKGSGPVTIKGTPIKLN